MEFNVTNLKKIKIGNKNLVSYFFKLLTDFLFLVI